MRSLKGLWAAKMLFQKNQNEYYIFFDVKFDYKVRALTCRDGGLRHTNTGQWD